VILRSSPGNSDLFEIAYSIVLLKALEAERGPEGDIVIERDIVRYAVDAFFSGQLEDGTWPRSKPLFHYPEVGNAYCFEYELLVQMLAERRLWPSSTSANPTSSKWDAPTRARNRGHASCARRECRVPRRTVRRIWCRCPLTGRAGGLDDLEMASLEWVETPTSARAIGRILPAEAEATYYS
jgi:hypothetical protein